jgi:predicted nucleotidyltransferase
MVTKKKSKKSSKKKTSSKRKSTKKSSKNTSKKNKIPTLNLKTDHEVAMDFAVKFYKKFEKVIKSIVLFGSVAEQKITSHSDIDIIIIIDDVSLNWDQELIAYYREELEKTIESNPYTGSLHINTIKLSTWWDDLLKGDPVVLNIIRTGFPLIDHGGFIEPLKHLMVRGKIKGTPEAIYQCLQRAPTHIARSKAAELAAIDGIYWSMVDAAHGALIAAGYFPPSPEHVIVDIRDAFVTRKILKPKYLEWYKEIFYLYKKVSRKEISDLKGIEIDEWQKRAEEFLEVMISLTERIISKK